jgi:hypothetical protein
MARNKQVECAIFRTIEQVKLRPDLMCYLLCASPPMYQW